MSSNPLKEKEGAWKIQTDLAYEVVVWFAKNELTIPNALIGFEINSINHYLDFIKANFSNEIIGNIYQNPEMVLHL